LIVEKRGTIFVDKWEYL